jgi:uncharacterized repeat protein (TIGR03803 family)
LDGSWTEKVLYRFDDNTDGKTPFSSLVFDATGNLYGTTYLGGSYGGGTVFKLTPTPHGLWTESLLYSFDGAAGANPQSSLVFDAAGSLYGTTVLGGRYGYGTVFKLTPNPDGSWTESVLQSFAGTDGAEPIGGLIFDVAGNLYGTTFVGGQHGAGTIFKLTPNPDGSWTESVLYPFAGNPAAAPQAGLVLDQAGNLYGTTTTGGHDCGGNNGTCGTVFRLAPNLDGNWAFKVLHVFNAKPAMIPLDSLVLDKAGNLYGTTLLCGSSCNGVVFEVTP